MKFIGGVPNIKTLVTSLMSQFLQKSGFWGYGEVECYLIIPELEFKVGLFHPISIMAAVPSAYCLLAHLQSIFIPKVVQCLVLPNL